MTQKQWIDAHVHIFPHMDAQAHWPKLHCLHDRVNTPSSYLSLTHLNPPQAAVVVHFSQAPDSAHVIGALDDMAHSTIRVRGVLKADVADERFWEWVKRDDIAGVRLYAAAKPVDFSDKDAWDRLWRMLRAQNKHVAIFGAETHLRESIRHIPEDIVLVIDHLGMPQLKQGTNGHHFNQLLADMVSRNTNAAPVYYKGPGYRTSLDASHVAPFAVTIAEKLGIERLILGASDAPFAGVSTEQDPRFMDKPFGLLLDMEKVNRFTETLSNHLATHFGLNHEEVFHQTHFTNAQQVYF